MELRDAWREYAREWPLAAFIGVMFLCFGMVWQQLQPVTTEATLLLNIGRTGVTESTTYDYESFYRLQADERFADTVVRWLQSPRVVADIARESGLAEDALPSGYFRARRLSSQVVEVRMKHSKTEVLRALSRTSVRVLNRYAASLNQGETKEGWFVLIGSEPIMRDARVSPPRALLGAAIGAAFVALFVVALKIYFSAPSGRSNHHENRY